jgi:serine/threonine protein kinase
MSAGGTIHSVMSLNSGSRLGPYEVVAPLGAGGMGEVYRARDTRLEREVAIKVLPAEVSGRDDLRQRFEREARAISSLHHPHICALHDIGEQDGISYLVMELLRGETLDKRIERGPIPAAEALRIAIQIGGALEQAHGQGLIHRDLKPANVMLTDSGAKLLDFGLAKAAAPRNAPLGLSAAATRTQHLTMEGAIVGTLGYMAPEQLEGKDTDARTDIFAFGVVLYEMLTGTRAFAGESQASLITAIMSADPISPAALQPAASPALERTLRQCVAKSADQRWHCMHDLVSELKWIAEGGAPAGLTAAPVQARFAPWRYLVAGAVAIALISTAALYVRWSGKAPPSRAISLDFVLPEKLHMRSIDIPTPSPDGERIVFSAMNADNKYTLWIRSLNSPALRQLPGTEGAILPFWSPDGREAGFFADGKLKRVDLAGGMPQTIAEIANNIGGATWSSKGTILFGNNGTLYAVPAQGGEHKVVRALRQGEYTQYWPQFLPDGEHFLYAFQSSSQDDNGFYVGSLDGKLRRKLLGPDTKAMAVDGYLLFSRNDVLYAQEFDFKSLELRGQPKPLSDHVLTFGTAYGANFFASLSRAPNDVLAYRTGSTGSDVELTWFDRSGNRLSTLGAAAQFSNPALSPDGKWMAVGRKDAKGGRDLWLFDLGRGTNTRLTFDPGDELNPIWSPDGKQIAFTGTSKSHRDIYVMDAHGTRAPELLLESPEEKNVEQWSPDGKYLVYNTNPKPGAPQNLYVLPLFGDRKPIAMLTSPFIEDMGQISPNGKWLAYRSNESGTSEVYVLAFAPNDPAARRKWRISTDGGMEPQWRAAGKELFYLNSSTLMSVEVKGDGREFEAGLPKVLFDTMLGSITRNRYVVNGDGQRFLMVTMPKDQVHPEIHVMVNWEAGLRR